MGNGKKSYIGKAINMFTLTHFKINKILKIGNLSPQFYNIFEYVLNLNGIFIPAWKNIINNFHLKNSKLFELINTITFVHIYIDNIFIIYLFTICN